MTVLIYLPHHFRHPTTFYVDPPTNQSMESSVPANQRTESSVSANQRRENSVPANQRPESSGSPIKAWTVLTPPIETLAS